MLGRYPPGPIRHRLSPVPLFSAAPWVGDCATAGFPLCGAILGLISYAVREPDFGSEAVYSLSAADLFARFFDDEPRLHPSMSLL